MDIINVTNYANNSLIGDSNLTKTLDPKIRKSMLSSPPCLFIVIMFFVIGVFGNFLALLILAKKKNSKNTKYTLMLRCLTTNNLIGLMGMLTQLIFRIYLPVDFQDKFLHLNCIGIVVWRFFGLSSGCIAATMSIERYMALARPFTYHKHITYKIVRNTIQFLVTVSTIITFLPLIGFGVYYDDQKKICLRYRDATSILGIAYAYIFMIFGTLLCVVIVICNFFVTRVLCFIGRRKTSKNIIQPDVPSRTKSEESSFISTRSQRNIKLFNHQNSTTNSDEIRFAKLMTFLSISFVICWMPQMISVPLALMPHPLPKSHWFFRIADILMALHFTSDPYVYVISRSKYSFIKDCRKFWRNKTNVKRTSSNQHHLYLNNIEHTVDYGLNS